MNLAFSLDTTVMAPAEKLRIAKKLIQDDAWLAKFMGRHQRAVIKQCLDGEEALFFAERMCELYEQIKTAPVTYEQDGKGKDAIIHFHYFTGFADWYITELDIDGLTLQAFGSANLGNGAELGYISIDELTANNMELDLHWVPKTLRECGAK